MAFFAREAIGVGVSQSATGTDRVAERIVPVAGGQTLTAVFEIGNVPVPIRVVVVVRGPRAGSTVVPICPGQKAADAGSSPAEIRYCGPNIEYALFCLSGKRSGQFAH